MKLISLFISIIFFAQVTFGACNQPVTYLTEGSKTTCTGYLFTPEAEMDVRETKMNHDRLQQLTMTQEKLIEILNKRVNNNTLQNENLRNEVSNLETANTWTKVLYFGLGVLATGLVFQLKDSK
jgi:hypothetical protein